MNTASSFQLGPGYEAQDIPIIVTTTHAVCDCQSLNTPRGTTSVLMNYGVVHCSAPAQRSPRGDLTDTRAQNPKQKPYFLSTTGQGPRAKGMGGGNKCPGSKGSSGTQLRQAEERSTFHTQVKPPSLPVAHATSSGAPGQAQAKVTAHST